MAEPIANLRRHGLMARLARALLVLAILAVLLIAVAWIFARPGSPDAFYAPPPGPVPPPGTLVRVEPFTRDVPAGARAWRILYATTRIGNRAALASAIVMVPRAQGTGPRPMIAWAHGTTGTAPGCAPSVMEHPFANVPAIPSLLTAGWGYVATDYAGLGTAGDHAYLIGDDAGRAVLDAARAARTLADARLGDRVVVWGHSQGGNSALWTGIRSTAYAPDLRVAGVAAMAPASDLRGLVDKSRASIFGRIVSAYLITAYARFYPDVRLDDYVSWPVRPIVQDIAGRCIGGRRTLFSVAEAAALPHDGIFAGDPLRGAFGKRLAENSPAAPIIAPVLIAQGDRDDLVLPALQRGYVDARCKAGQPIDYRVYAGRDHVSLVAGGSPLESDLIAWSRDRFAGAPARSTCRP